MSEVFDCSDGAQLLQGTRLARQSLGRGELIVMPTDTVYGVAADAFSPEAVQRLLDAKGRGRQSPPPVLIPNVVTLAALAAEATEALHDLADAFWPGALTIITQANPSLSWDLGETGGTVALRIPGNEFARELLQETGPLAVSSANKTGLPAAGSAQEARDMLGDSIAVYLDGGDARGEASTIIDATLLGGDGTGTVRVLRQGSITVADLQRVLPDATVLEQPAPSATPLAETEAESEPAGGAEPVREVKPAPSGGEDASKGDENSEAPRVSD
ncbi:L-threonylcarbamoyladenylate synthase [Leucobacter aridicollis]|uniref:L-threonylcarbamoyladenylate synthase n=1 Tax=Leucobacter aridicollis TaxID=283878 RepID=UPI0021070896|nr:L-threonylcarbamoyladenylate synthase [Leucobacter aridicollis]UTX52462.1 threonylcarbamoyl-AMP synthase [Leucobacter aridicollis]